MEAPCVHSVIDVSPASTIPRAAHQQHGLFSRVRHSLVMLLLEDPDHRLTANHAEMLLEVRVAQQWAPFTDTFSTASNIPNASHCSNASAAARNALAELQHSTKTINPSTGILPLLHAALVTGPEEPQVFRISDLSSPQLPSSRPMSYATVTSATSNTSASASHIASGRPLMLQPASVIWLQLDQLQNLSGCPAYTGILGPNTNPTENAMHRSNQPYTTPLQGCQTDTDSADQSLLGPQIRKTSRELFVPSCMEGGFDFSCTARGLDTIAAAAASTPAQRFKSGPGPHLGHCSPHAPRAITADCSQAAQEDSGMSDASSAASIFMLPAHDGFVLPIVSLSTGEDDTSPDAETPTSASNAQGLRVPLSPPAPLTTPNDSPPAAGSEAVATGAFPVNLGRTEAVAVRSAGSSNGSKPNSSQLQNMTAVGLNGRSSQAGEAFADGALPHPGGGHSFQEGLPLHSSAKTSLPADGSPNSWSMFPGSLPAINVVPPPCETLTGLQTWPAASASNTATTPIASTCSSAPIMGQATSLGVGFGGLDGLGVGSCSISPSASSSMMQHHQQQQQQQSSSAQVCSDEMFACMLAEMARTAQQQQQRLSASNNDTMPRSWESSVSQCEAPSFVFSPPQRQPHLARRQTDACDSFFMHPATNMCWPQMEGGQQGRMTDSGGFLTGGSPGQGLEQMTCGNRNLYRSPGSVSASQVLQQQRLASRSSCGAGTLPLHDELSGTMPFPPISSAGLVGAGWAPAMPTHKSFAAAAAALAPGPRHGAATHVHGGYTLSLQQQQQLQQRAAAYGGHAPMGAQSLSSRASSMDGASSDGGVFGVSAEPGTMMGGSYDAGGMKHTTHLQTNIPASPLQSGDPPAKATSLPGTHQLMGYAAMVAKQAPPLHSSSPGTDPRSGPSLDLKLLRHPPPPLFGQALAMQQQYQQQQLQQQQQQRVESHVSYDVGQGSGSYDPHQGLGVSPPGGAMWVRQDCNSMRPRPSPVAQGVMGRPCNLSSQSIGGQLGSGMMRGDGSLAGTSADSSRNLAGGVRMGNVQMDSRWPGRVSMRVQDEIAALLLHTPMIKLEDFDDGVLHQLSLKRSDEEAVAALRCLAGDDIGNIQHMAAYINSVIKNFQQQQQQQQAQQAQQAQQQMSLGSNPASWRMLGANLCDIGSSPYGPAPLRSLPPVSPMASNALLGKLPLRVYKHLEEVINNCSHMDWRHFDAGVVKVMGQLAEVCESDVFEELELLKATDLSNVEYMPAYLNKRLNNRLWQRRKAQAAIP